MDLILLFKAALLGIIEGLTEFLPVSSTGHLIIAADVLDFNGENAPVFEIVIQLGAILGVAWDYRARLARAVMQFRSPIEQRFVFNLFLAFLPAAILGLLLHEQIKTHLFNPFTVAIALIVGGIVILIIERLPLQPRVAEVDAMSPRDAFKIGLAQTLSLFPGVSRAGATIMGGLLAGLTRTAATEFSFFLALPVMLAATTFELSGNIDKMNDHDVAALAVGFVLSFITAMIVVRLFLRYVSHHDFTLFAWYRIVFGLVVLYYAW